MQETLIQTEKIMNYPLFKLGNTEFTLASIITFLLLLTLVIVLVSVAKRILISRLLRKTRMDEAMQYAFVKITGYALTLLGLYIALGIVGIDLSSLALVAGAIGVGLGFGLQNIISNFVSGVIILFERCLKVGDFVELESGVTGEVKEINMRSTLINTNDNIDILVPNSEFVNGRVINWTLREASRRIHVPFGVAYGTDKELVRQAGLEAAEKVPFAVLDQENRKPQVWFTGFGSSSLDYELVVWIGPDSVKRPGAVQAAFLWEIHTALYKHGLEIPFPQNDLHLRSIAGMKDEEMRKWMEERFKA